MGAARAAIVRAIQPRGPYALAGFCNGGLIALATARELATSGATVDTLALIDTPSGHVLAPTLRGVIDRLDHVMARFLRSERAVTRLVGEGLHYWYRWRDLSLMTASARRDIIKGRLHAMARSLGVARAGRDMNHAAPLRPGQIHFGKLNDAARHFLPRPHAGPLMILVSRMAAHHRYLPARWRHLAAQPEIREVPGTHLSCITREGATVAAELRRSLERRRSS